MTKRLFDIFISFFSLVFILPILIFFCLIIFFQDFGNPLYISKRVGKNFREFNMFKLRSMVVDADKTGIASTTANDQRITKIGKLVRKYKLDEFTQLVNVLLGDMSLVGPRPNILIETNLYSSEEKKLLSIKPGITDFSSIVFSDEAEILSESKDPNLDYNRLIRPGKSYLGLIYLEQRSFFLDIEILFLTLYSFFFREKTLKKIEKILRSFETEEFIIDISIRKEALKPLAPPGMNNFVKER